MISRTPFIALWVFALSLASTLLVGGPSGVENLGKRETGLSNKRVEPRMWQSQRNTALMQKTFPIQEWDKHFSSVGSKRAPIRMSEARGKKIFETNTKTFPKKDFNRSRWNQHFAELHQQARISTDGKARKIADRQLYNMMLHDARKYEDMGEKLSLRDINRYQFRHNRSDEAVPVQAAGAEQ